MPKFKHKRKGRVIEAIFYDGSQKSFERVKNLIASDVVVDISMIPSLKCGSHVEERAIGYFITDGQSKTEYFFARGYWIFIVGGLPYIAPIKRFFNVYRSVRASTPLS